MARLNAANIMNIQDEVQKIHKQYGTTEMANYQIEKLFDRIVKHQNLFKEEEVITFAQNMISQYKGGNTNIEQRELLKESLKNKL